MCKVSDQIKFCTCAETDNPKALDNYWVLHQPDELDDDVLVGMCLPPTSFADPNFVWNERVILNRLNEGNAFDKPLKFKKHDRLEVVVNCENMPQPFNYNFKYTGRKWRTVAEDVFELLSNYKPSKKGTISEAIK